MTISSLEKTLIHYSELTIKRAEIALFCCVFNLTLFITMMDDSVYLLDLVGEKGKNKGYTNKCISERKVEQDLIWLIKVGVLRREVDGQGITDSFRLTPLGKKLTLKWQRQGGNFPKPSFGQRIINFINYLLSMFLL